MVFQMDRWTFEQISCSKNEGLITFNVVELNILIKVIFEHTSQGLLPSATYIKTEAFDIPIEVLHAFLAAVRREYPKGF